MTTQDNRAVSAIPVESEPEAVAAAWAGGPGQRSQRLRRESRCPPLHFRIRRWGLRAGRHRDLPGAASAMFIAVALGIGAGGLLVGGLWEFRRGELFGGTFGVAYSGSCCPPA